VGPAVILGVEATIVTASTRALLKRILRLPPAQRVGLAYEILESVEKSDEGRCLSPEWRDEIERRIENVLSGKAGPGEDHRVVMKRIGRRYEKKHGRSS
jgi:putative addiction module component (TIGR02574 family)